MSLERWDGVWRRNQHLVSGLLEADPTLRVLFVEPAADPLHTLLHRSRPRPGAGLRQVDAHGKSWAGRLWSYQPTKWLPRRLDPRTDGRLTRAVVRAAAGLGMDAPVLWVNDPFGAQVLESTGWRALYDITDDWLLAERSPEESGRLRRHEALLMERCAEVVVCSRRLEQDKGQIRPVHLVPNAVDLQAYRTLAPRPRDLPDGPVALYVGTLHRDRLDVELALNLATTLTPTARLVFVGPIALDAEDTHALQQAGALLLGARPAEQVPAYLQHADVLVVPHVVTPFTESLDPIKAYEYRAAGRPVVSTPVPGFRDSSSLVVTSVGDHEEFVTAVVERLGQKRLDSVTDDEVPDWGWRVAQMEAVIRQVRGTSVL